MKRWILSALALAGCAGGSGDACEIDGDCQGGLVCASTSVCAATSDLRPLPRAWFRATLTMSNGFTRTGTIPDASGRVLVLDITPPVP